MLGSSMPGEFPAGVSCGGRGDPEKPALPLATISVLSLQQALSPFLALWGLEGLPVPALPHVPGCQADPPWACVNKMQMGTRALLGGSDLHQERKRHKVARGLGPCDTSPRTAFPKQIWLKFGLWGRVCFFFFFWSHLQVRGSEPRRDWCPGIPPSVQETLVGGSGLRVRLLRREAR